MTDMRKRGIDTTDDSAVAAYHNEVRYELSREVIEATGAKKHKIKFYFNGMPRRSGLLSHA